MAGYSNDMSMAFSFNDDYEVPNSFAASDAVRAQYEDMADTESNADYDEASSPFHGGVLRSVDTKKEISNNSGILLFAG